MRKTLPFVYIGLIAVILTTAGCAKFLGGLRRDLDDSEPSQQDSPTVGGRWVEGGFLDQDMPDGGAYAGGGIGHSDRAPASMPDGARGSASRNDSWVSQDQSDSNHRDMYRGMGDDQGEQTASFSNTPRLDPPTKRAYKNGARATRADFVDESPNEGSLWGSDGQTNYYFTKNKVRGVGDIVTVTLEADIVRDMALEVKRTLSPRERDVELALAQDRIKAKVYGQGDSLATSAAAPSRTLASAPKAPDAAAGDSDNAKPYGTPPPEEAAIPVATTNDIDVTKTLEVKAGDTMMGEITQRYPNGNYEIRAVKKVNFKSGTPRLVTVVAVVKSTDISEDDQLNSGKLYEYRIEAVR